MSKNTEPDEKKFSLEEKQMQRRLSHYIKEYKDKNGLLSKEVAKEIGYTPQKFSELERDHVPHSRFMNSLGFLRKLAELKYTSISSFIRYIEGKEERTKNTETNYTWQKDLLSAFESLPMSTRKQFIDTALSAKRSENKRKKFIAMLKNITIGLD